MGKKIIRIPNPCRCDRLHVWTDCTVSGRKDAWDCYYTVVIDDEDEAGLAHRRQCVHDGELFAFVGIGNKTSNEGEYSGVIGALVWARDTGQRVHVITDSKLIVGHVVRGDKCMLHLQPYRDKVLRLLKQTDAVVAWKPRDFNKAGWYNDRRLNERHAAKASREALARIGKREKAMERMDKKLRRPVTTKVQQAQRRRWAMAERDVDND